MAGIGPKSLGRRRAMAPAAAISLALHAAVLAAFVLGFRHAPPVSEAPPAQGAVELVMVENAGAGHTVQATPPSPPATPPALSPPQNDAALPPPPPPPQRQAAIAPQINVGGPGDETNAIAFGGEIVPASIDAKYHNREPAYPPEAARYAEQGAVTLMIHVSPQGLASGVDVLEGSGYAVLDRAARDAVATWHFLPAIRDGEAVPFTMPVRIVFRLD